MSENLRLEEGEAGLLGRYQHWRTVATELHNRLAKNLGDGVLEEGGRALGILDGKTFMFDTEDQMAVLMDYCIHDVYRDGKNAVDRCLAEETVGDEERVLLEAKGRGRYAVLKVVGVKPGLGVEVEDIFRQDRMFLVDVNFSRTAGVGAMMASRLSPVEDFWMTAGAGLPVSGEASRVLESRLGEWGETNAPDWGNLSRELEISFTRLVVRTCLHEAQDVEMMYEESGKAENAWSRREMPGWDELEESEMPATREGKVGRNEPCPCGSGRKYKKCCGG